MDSVSGRPSIEALDHVAIEVTDLDLALKFYSEIIGLKQIPAPAVAFEKGIRWFELPDSRMLHLVTNSEAKPFRIGHLAFRVKDVVLWKEYLTSLGIQEEPAMVKLYGEVERIFVRDPSGNRLEFLKWVSAT